MSDQEIISIMKTAMFDANITHPVTETGMIRDKIYHPQEETGHKAEAILKALRAKGYDIVKSAPETPSAS